MNKSGRQVGAEYTEALLGYLQALRKEGQGVPARGGKVSVAAVALASGVDKQSLYKNPRCRELLEEAAQELGLQSIEARATGTTKNEDAKSQRIQVLELQVSSLQAEVEGLRRKLRNFAHIEEHMVESGKRVIP
jgi:hypothetical protein